MDFLLAEGDEVPRFSKASIWVQGKTLESASVLARIERQNPGIKTTDWAHITSSQDEKGQTMVFYINQKSITWLRANGFKKLDQKTQPNKTAKTEGSADKSSR
jgi:N-acetylglutamate synthase-like GNAT family acetyltransferase